MFFWSTIYSYKNLYMYILYIANDLLPYGSLGGHLMLKHPGTRSPPRLTVVTTTARLLLLQYST